MPRLLVCLALIAVGTISCMIPRKLRWKKKLFPLTCIYDDSISERVVTAINKSIKQVNEAAGVTVFMYCVPWKLKKKMPRKIKNTIIFSTRNPETTPISIRDNTIATAHLFYNELTGNMTSAYIHLAGNLHKSIIQQTIVHELLHVLGFEHNENPNSIMFPTTATLFCEGKCIDEETEKQLRRQYE